MGPATRTAIPSLLAMLALLGALQTLVLNPLAAAPADRSLTQIYADLAPQVSVFELAAFPALAFFAGIGGALVLGRLARRRPRIDPLMLLTMGLGLLTAAAPAYWVASFGMGLGLADTYMISGGDHSPWAWPIHLASTAAALGLLVCLIARSRGLRHPR
ncbi:hypothetical protein RB202_08030 [Micrococcus yunnanensis]|uniref:hypothetical protein n=2 Tax=Micrococcus TaxID=1269 RepID=UPI003015623F